MLWLLSCTSSVSSHDTHNSALESFIDYEHSNWTHAFSVVYEGNLLHNQDTIFKETAPAGIDAPITLSFVISNLQSEPLSLEGSWLQSDRITWSQPPPSVLEPEEEQHFALQFQPQSCTHEETISSTLQIPNHDFSIEITLHCPPPLRTVLLGDDGFTLISDDYGASFYEANADMENLPSPLRAQSITWGNGIFLRSFAKGTSPDALGMYQYSYDGIAWFDSQYEQDYAPSDCTYGLGRFVCVRTDSLSWSIDGRSITHEPALGDFRLQKILFRNDAFVAVGKGARRVRSEDAKTWSTESFGIDPDTYHSLVQSSDLIVAAGGINRYFISYSSDDGQTWNDVPYGGCQGNFIQTMIFHNNIFLAQGASSCHHNMHRSFNGINWEPVFELQPFDRFVLLGALNGYFIAQSTDPQLMQTKLYRSTDGYSWSEQYTLPNNRNIRLMSNEEWSP